MDLPDITGYTDLAVRSDVFKRHIMSKKMLHTAVTIAPCTSEVQTRHEY